jgi:hypothetical protein
MLAAALGAMLGALVSGAAAQTPAAAWKSECSACHMAYPPGLLPERSWRKLMAELDKHFGQDASLDAATTKAILDYLVANSGERSSLRRAARFLQAVPPGTTPLRISENPHFVREHREVAPDVWKLPKVGSRANCNACHADADEGGFSERNVRIPR